MKFYNKILNEAKVVGYILLNILSGIGQLLAMITVCAYLIISFIEEEVNYKLTEYTIVSLAVLTLCPEKFKLKE